MRYLTAVLILLGACATQPGTKAQPAPLAAWGPTCERLGFQNGSTEFGNCVLCLAARREGHTSGACNAATSRVPLP